MPVVTYVAKIEGGEGGAIPIVAASIRDAQRDAEEWADEGDYPVPPATPPTVRLTLEFCGEVVAEWDHRVPASACSGVD